MATMRLRAIDDSIIFNLREIGREKNIDVLIGIDESKVMKMVKDLEASEIVKAFYEQGIDATVLKDKIVFLKSCVFDFGTNDNYDVTKAENFKKELTSLCDRLIKEGTLNGKTEEIISIHQVNERYLVEGDRENIYLQNERTITANEGKKIISDLKAKSSTVLIEAGADVSKSVKYRLDSVKSAFESALAQVVPDNGSYTLRFSDAKQSFAELNLARPKDRAIAIDNLIKRLKSTEVTLVDVFGEEKTTLGELLSPEQEKQARDIMLSTLNGKAEPTKLAKWARALGLQKIKTHETARSFKLMRSIQNKISHGTVNYLSTFTDAVGELTLFDNIIKEVKLPFTNASILSLANNIATYYTADNFGKMLSDYGVPYNDDVYDRAVALKETIQKGRPLTAEQITEALTQALNANSATNRYEITGDAELKNFYMTANNGDIAQINTDDETKYCMFYNGKLYVVDSDLVKGRKPTVVTTLKRKK